MGTCPGCSASNQPGSSFCWQCYAPLSERAERAATLEPIARTPERRWRFSIPGPGQIIGHTLVGLFVLSVIGSIWLVLERRQVTLPDTVAGFERIENPDFDAYAREVEEELGIAVSAGTYLRGRRFFGVMVGSELDDARPADRIRELPAIQDGVAFQKAKIRSFQSPTAFFACVPFVGLANGTLCLWNGSGTSGLLYAEALGMRSARELARQVQVAVGS
ncbi:MAG TPA: NUDIX hydrolase [Actinomycetota bacterium]